ncbi:hypothetical protein C8R46DRAFT_1222505 [Mycena filopes]|nr:hypothetical protein C8R46DRAFT_1222505 [Mycena filopes]
MAHVDSFESVSDAPKFPALESLVILLLENRQMGGVPFNADGLSDMLRTRASRGLRHFELLSRRALPDMDDTEVALRAEGMRIRVQTVSDLKGDYLQPVF